MSGMNLLVFREDQRRASGQELRTAVTAQLEQVCGYGSQEAVLGALLLAGELECGVADGDCEAAHTCELLTDRIADALLFLEAADPPDFAQPNFQNILDTARALSNLTQLSISIPEGFAYYALHPL